MRNVKVRKKRDFFLYKNGFQSAVIEHQVVIMVSNLVKDAKVFSNGQFERN